MCLRGKHGCPRPVSHYERWVIIKTLLLWRNLEMQWCTIVTVYRNETASNFKIFKKEVAEVA
jgi:hypothetical protein